MPAPQKNGLDYFPLEVGFFSDKKIKRLRAKFGNDGVCVLLYLYTEIYREGYYIIYDDDLILDISDELNISENLTRQIADHLLSRTMLTVCEMHGGNLAESVKVLTAKSIQRRFQLAKKGLKRDVFVEAECWLLEKSETLDFIKMHPHDNKSEINPSKSEINDDKSENYHTKESKGKERKVKESKEKEYSADKPHTPARARFTPPTLEEVRQYCRERNSTVDPQSFIDYYTANGWIQGKGKPIKDWKAAVRYWEKNGYDSGKKQSASQMTNSSLGSDSDFDEKWRQIADSFDPWAELGNANDGKDG